MEWHERVISCLKAIEKKGGTEKCKLTGKEKEINLQNDSGDKKGAEQLAKKGALAWKRLNSQTGISSFLPLGARTDLADIQ